MTTFNILYGNVSCFTPDIVRDSTFVRVISKLKDLGYSFDREHNKMRCLRHRSSFLKVDEDSKKFWNYSGGWNQTNKNLTSEQFLKD